MKTFVHLGPLVLALAVAGLLAGCASSHRSTQSRQVRLANDFEVVETSTKRLLTPAEMAQLKLDVAKYLEQEGAVASGDYYVKIFLPASEEGAPMEWVIVRYSRNSDLRYSLLAAYPTNTPGYQSYAAYDYYPYGYDHFSRFSFHYYDDPYYGSHYYFPHVHRDRDRDRGRDGRHDRDRNRGQDGRRDTAEDNRSPDRVRFKPNDPAGTPPPHVTRTRDNNDRGRNGGDRGNRTRDNNDGPRRGGTPGQRRSDNPTANTYSPSTRTSSQPAPRTESYRSDSNRGDSSSSRTSSQSAPSYSQPATRSETNSNSSSGQREANEHRRRLE